MSSSRCFYAMFRKPSQAREAASNRRLRKGGGSAAGFVLQPVPVCVGWRHRSEGLSWASATKSRPGRAPTRYRGRQIGATNFKLAHSDSLRCDGHHNSDSTLLRNRGTSALVQASRRSGVVRPPVSAEWPRDPSSPVVGHPQTGGSISVSHRS